MNPTAAGLQAQLTPQQKKALESHLKKFHEYLQSDSFKMDLKDRNDRVSYFQKEFPQKLKGLSEFDVEEVVTKLWATRIWGNKLYHVQKIIADNGIEKIKLHFHKLLNASEPIPDRYQVFLNEIKGFGPASITEILCYLYPDVCGIWNKVAREALIKLGLEHFVDPTKYRLSAAEYDKFNQVLRGIASELGNYGIQNVDLLFVDFFLWEVTKTTKKPDIATKEDFDHDEVKDLIDQIGSSLGFDTDTEVLVAHGAKVDAVWRARIGNLGLVTYVFEVHRKGSIDSLLLNLQKANSNPTVQKVIAVSDQVQLDIIKQESEGLPEEFRKALGFWLVSQVEKVGENLQEAMTVINSLGLVQGGF